MSENKLKFCYKYIIFCVINRFFFLAYNVVEEIIPPYSTFHTYPVSDRLAQMTFLAQLI